MFITVAFSLSNEEDDETDNICACGALLALRFTSSHVDNEEDRVWELFRSSWSLVHSAASISSGVAKVEGYSVLHTMEKKVQLHNHTEQSIF